jgi:glycosyltransferase involved in cell wall biosynthesis
VTLGVRQDFPAYVRQRRPGSRGLRFAAGVLEGCWRLLARRSSVVVVGPDLARRYATSGRLLEISVSLVSERDLVTAPPRREYDGELRALSVGRIDAEKNPLLLADVLDVLVRADDRWRLVVCGEGPLLPELEARLRDLGVADRAALLGYVPVDGGLSELYRSSHALVHCSWTEGVPQVLFEAFAAGLPVVATAVGGVADAVGDAALLVPPGEPDPPANALLRLAREPELRERLIDAGLERARGETMEEVARRVARFLTAAERP